MSSNEICQESRKENSRWKTIERRCKAIPRLKSFFYIYDLEKGCRIIAGFEALHFCMGLGLVTLLNSLLLFIGSKWGHQVCLFLWIYITLFTTLISNVNNTLRNFNFTQAFITFPSLALEGYFALVVVSLICKLHEKRDDCISYSEMHNKKSTEQI
ncbi:uncharacterized protein LOC122614636 isoform X2 [Drosophila teissieri]|uniref:uncharacterized protein LOC122614636 isoform X2 n=1 Tax=Drosophila teissieri TaxID=7243 RepID=UPI001CB9F1EF|nr:uncharacterized protein LOC122614636 isoform X2 [Drosophila teissieri]